MLRLLITYAFLTGLNLPGVSLNALNKLASDFNSFVYILC